MSRIEEIRSCNIFNLEPTRDDIEWLIKRVEELEAENQRLESEIRKRDELLDRMA